MPEIAWDINRIEAQAKKWQEMASALPNDHDRVAWLIEQNAYLSASHMQLQEVFRLTIDGWLTAGSNQSMPITSMLVAMMIMTETSNLSERTK